MLLALFIIIGDAQLRAALLDASRTHLRMLSALAGNNMPTSA